MALYGLAIGDALGMPTQLMSHEEVAACFGVLDGFREAPADHPIAAGLPAGSITDDTEQALLLADACSSAADTSTARISPAGWWPGQNARGNGDRWICWGHQAARQQRRRRSVPHWMKHVLERPMGQRCGSLRSV